MDKDKSFILLTGILSANVSEVFWNYFLPHLMFKSITEIDIDDGEWGWCLEEYSLWQGLYFLSKYHFYKIEI